MIASKSTSSASWKFRCFSPKFQITDVWKFIFFFYTSAIILAKLSHILFFPRSHNLTQKKMLCSLAFERQIEPYKRSYLWLSPGANMFLQGHARHWALNCAMYWKYCYCRLLIVTTLTFGNLVSWAESLPEELRGIHQKGYRNRRFSHWLTVHFYTESSEVQLKLPVLPIFFQEKTLCHCFVSELHNLIRTCLMQLRLFNSFFS